MYAHVGFTMSRLKGAAVGRCSGRTELSTGALITNTDGPTDPKMGLPASLPPLVPSFSLVPSGLMETPYVPRAEDEHHRDDRSSEPDDGTREWGSRLFFWKKYYGQVDFSHEPLTSDWASLVVRLMLTYRPDPRSFLFLGRPS